MKTNSVMELLKAKGVGVETKTSPVPTLSNHQSPSKRKRLYQSSTSDKTSEQHTKQTTAVSSPLDSQQLAVSQALAAPLVRRETGVSSPLDEKNPENLAVSQALAAPLVRRETGVRKLEISALDASILIGKEKELLSFICEHCRKLGSLETNYISTEDLRIKFNINSNGLRNLIARVKEKGFFDTNSKQLGRSGLRKFKVVQAVYQQFLGSALVRRETGVSSPLGQALGQALDGFPSSSSSYVFEDLKTTTTREPELFDQEAVRLTLAPEWERVDHSSLTDIGFKQSHLIQVARQGKITAQETQDSIHFFAFDLRRNGKALSLSGPPINFFMGILSKGIPYAPPENYVSSEDELRREYRERMKSLEEKRVSEAQEIWDLHFREWESKLSSNECARILPEYAKKSGPMRENCLKSHFNEHVWPELRETVPGIQSLFTSLAGPSSEDVDLRPAT